MSRERSHQIARVKLFTNPTGVFGRNEDGLWRRRLFCSFLVGRSYGCAEDLRLPDRMRAMPHSSGTKLLQFMNYVEGCWIRRSDVTECVEDGLSVHDH